MSRIVVMAIAASLFVGAALAQDTQQPTQHPAQQPPNNPQSDPVTAVVGAWELSNADHDKTCRLNFRADAAPGGNKIDVDKNCPSVFPSTKDIIAWAVDNYGSLRLLNAQGDAVIELTEVESGMYDGFTPEEGRYVMQSAAAAPICTLSLANTAAAAGSDNLALKLKPGCDALVTRFGPTSWHMDNGELVLQSARGQTWRFEENDTNTWQRLPESADPILLVRQ
jgi:Protease inhibitor Inh